MHHNIFGLWSTSSCVWNADNGNRNKKTKDYPGRRFPGPRRRGIASIWSLILLVFGFSAALLIHPDTSISQTQKQIELIKVVPQGPDTEIKPSGLSQLPFDISRVIEKAEHLIQKDPSNSGHYWVEDSRYRVIFAPGGVIYYQKHNGAFLEPYRLQFRLEAIRSSDRLIFSTNTSSSISIEENSAVYKRTPVISELYEVRNDGVEQSWLIDQPLSDRPEDLIIQGRLLTPLSPQANKDGGIDFVDDNGRYVTTYGKVIVIDEAGRRLTISPHYKDTDLTITVPAEWLAEAAYPVVVDPLIGSNIQVDNLATPDNYPAIAFDGTNYLLAWQTGTPAADGTGNTAIKGARVDRNGSVLDTPTPLDIGDTLNQDDEFPSVAYDSLNSRFIVVWMTWNSTTSADILMNTVTAAGVVGTASVILAGGTSILAYPSVACCDLNDNYYIIFGQSGAGSTDFTQYLGQTYDRTTHAAAIVSDPAAVVSSGTITPETAPASAPRLYSLSTTQYLLLWETFGVDISGDISANVATVDTLPSYAWGTEVSVAAAAGTLERYPRSAYDGTNALIVYQLGAGTAADIYGRFLDPGTMSEGAVFPVSTPAGSGETYPDIAYTAGICQTDPVNRYLVAWQDYRNDPANPDIYGVTLDTAGNVGTEVAILSDITFGKTWPVVASDDGSCGYMTAWSDGRNSATTSSDIYAQLVGYPNINNLNPASGPEGDTISINGVNFGVVGPGNRSTTTNNVRLDGTPLLDSDISSWTDTVIDFAIPTGTTVGTYSVTVTAGEWTSNGKDLTVTDPLQITASALPDGYQWLQYPGTTLTANGGTTPYSNWQVITGVLPEGLALDPNTGVISGTPTGSEASEIVTFTVQVSDSVSNTATQELSITVYKLTGITITDTLGTPVSPTISYTETFQFNARGAYSDTSQFDISGITPLEWKSSDITVSTIDANGLANGIGAGTATICAVTEGEACP